MFNLGASQEGVLFGDRTYSGMTNLRALFSHYITLLRAEIALGRRSITPLCIYPKTSSTLPLNVHSFVYLFFESSLFRLLAMILYTPLYILFYY